LNILVVFARDRVYAVSAHMLSQFHLSVCPSVTRVDQSKTVEDRIMQLSPYSSPIPLVFARWVSSRNSDGFPWTGVSSKGGIGKIRNFQPITRRISETVQDRTEVTVCD